VNFTFTNVEGQLYKIYPQRDKLTGMQKTVAYCGIENNVPWDTKSFSRILKGFDLGRAGADDEKWVGAAE